MATRDLATFETDGFGTIELFQLPGYGEWSCRIVEVRLADEPRPCITPKGARGEFIITGRIDTEIPTQWPEDHDEAVDGPKVPTLWFLSVGGIEVQIELEDTPNVALRCGLWVSVHVAELTYWDGEDDVALYYREVGPRRVVQKICDHLDRAGCRSFGFHRVEQNPDVWELRVRPCDFDRAGEIAASNVLDPSRR